MLQSIPAPFLVQVSLIATQHCRSSAFPSLSGISLFCSRPLRGTEATNPPTLVTGISLQSIHVLLVAPLSSSQLTKLRRMAATRPMSSLGQLWGSPTLRKEEMPFPHTQLVLWPHGVRTGGRGSHEGPEGSQGYGVTSGYGVAQCYGVR